MFPLVVSRGDAGEAGPSMRVASGQQHAPTPLPNGNLLIFDNGTLRGYSRVIELNPLTEEIAWEYDGKPEHGC